MYDCSKITRLTIMYTSEGPGHYAGEKLKILGQEDSLPICEEANRRKISIEMLLKQRESVESVVINTVLPFPVPEAEKSTAEEEPEEKAETAAVESPKKTEEPATA